MEEKTKQNNQNNWITHIEFMVLLVTLLGSFYLLNGKIERQGERTDKLYELYVEAREDSNKKWSDLLEKLYEKKY